MIVRPSTNNDGLAIRDLAKACGVLDVAGLDWSYVEGGWLVLEHEKESVCGAIQLCPGRPIFRLEFLLVGPQLSKRERAEAVRLLCLSGLEVARQYRASAVYSMVRDGEHAWMNILERHGCHPISGGIMYKRVL